MDDLDRIIRLIEDEPLSKGLTAALRIVEALPDQALAIWLRLELGGYNRDNSAMSGSVTVPGYRSVGGQWFDEYGNLLVLPDAELGFVNTTRLRHGVVELEHFVGEGGNSRTARMRLSGEAGIIKKNLGVDVSIFEFSRASIHQVLGNIRLEALSRLAAHRSSLSPSVPASKKGELLILKFTFWGMGVDLRELWRRIFARGR